MKQGHAGTMWRRIWQFMNWEITKRESPGSLKARRIAVKGHLGYFWYVGWVMLVVNVVLTLWAKHSTVQYTIRLENGAMWVGWNESSMYFDIQVLSASVFFGLCALLCGVAWKLERKTAMLIAAISIVAVQVWSVYFCLMPIEWSLATISRFSLPSAIIGLLYAEVLYIWIIGFQRVVIPEFKQKEQAR